MPEEVKTEIILDVDKAHVISRDTRIRLKCIALHSMGKSPLTNIYSFYKEDKEELESRMIDLLRTKTGEEIIKMFNEICIKHVFTTQADYSKLPIYDA